MLSNYNAQYITCFGSFVAKLPLDISDGIYYECKSYYDSFYKHVQSVFNGNRMFKNNSSRMISIMRGFEDIVRDINNSGADDNTKKKILHKLNKMGANFRRADEALDCAVRGCGPDDNPSKADYGIVMEDSFVVSHLYQQASVEKIDIKPRASDIEAIRCYIDKYRSLMIHAPAEAGRTTITLNSYKLTIDPERTERAFRPNLVHSVDALILRRIILKHVGPVLSIHDSVGCRALELYKLNNVVRGAYSSIRFMAGEYAFTSLLDVNGSYMMN